MNVATNSAEMLPAMGTAKTQRMTMNSPPAMTEPITR